LAEKIRRDVLDLAIPHERSSVASQVTVSLGVLTVQCTRRGSAKEIVAEVDRLLYRAKSSGRNRVAAAERAA
jgi:diguanylate cyclase (GGDEF)-like protein